MLLTLDLGRRANCTYGIRNVCSRMSAHTSDITFCWFFLHYKSITFILSINQKSFLICGTTARSPRDSWSASIQEKVCLEEAMKWRCATVKYNNVHVHELFVLCDTVICPTVISWRQSTVWHNYPLNWLLCNKVWNVTLLLVMGLRTHYFCSKIPVLVSQKGRGGKQWWRNRGRMAPHFSKVPILTPHFLPVKSICTQLVDKFLLCCNKPFSRNNSTRLAWRLNSITVMVCVHWYC